MSGNLPVPQAGYVLIESMHFHPRARTIKPTAILLGLSLLWAVDVLRSDLLPSPFRLSAELPYYSRMAFHWIVLAAGAGLLAAALGAWPDRRRAIDAALIGFGIFALPTVFAHLAAHQVADQTRVILFTLTLLFAVVIEPFLGPAKANQAPGNMAAAIVAVAGALLLFSFRLPGSIEEAAWFGLLVFTAACIACINCRAVDVAQSSGAVSFAGSAAFGAGVAALVFASLSAAVEPHSLAYSKLWPEALWALIVDLPALLAFFWLLRNMTATRMTLRFVLAPLFTALLSIVLFLPAVSLQAATGIALMAAGAGWVLFAPDGKESRLPSLLE